MTFRNGGAVCALIVLFNVGCGPVVARGRPAVTAPRAGETAGSVGERRVEAMNDGDPPVDRGSRSHEALAPVGPLGLSDLLAYAEARAPAVHIAQSEARAGEAEIDAASPLVPYNPELMGRLGGRTIEGTSRFEYRVQLTQQVQIAGQRAARMEAAERRRDSTAAGLRATTASIRFAVHGLYHQVLLRRLQRLAAEKVARFATEVQAITDKRIEAGETSPLRAMVIRAEVAQARQDAIATRLAERETLLTLKETIGWPADAELTVSGELPAPSDVPDAEALIARALAEHPRGRQLEEEVAAAQARVRLEDREGWPDPTLGVAFAQESEPGGPAYIWQGILTLPIPIWERNQAGRARARADRVRAEANRDAFLRRLGPRVAQLVARVDAAAERVHIYGQDILPAFEANLAKLQTAYDLGEIDVLELTQIRERLLRSQRDALTAMSDYFRAAAELEQQAGVAIWAHDR